MPWTKMPNFIFELLPHMKEAEMKVVMIIARQTHGWKREKVSLSVSDLHRMTGISKPSVVSGIKSALERGILRREEDGNSFFYSLVEPETVKNFNHFEDEETQDDSETINNFNQLSVKLEDSPEEDSKESLPVKNLNSEPQEPVKNLNTPVVKIFNDNKRNINTKKTEEEKESSNAQRCEHHNSPSLTKNPLIQAFRSLHHRYPSQAQMQIIAERNPPLEAWNHAIRIWASAGFKPTNVEGMLDWAFNPSLIEQFTHRKGSNNGTSNRSAATTYERPPVAQFSQREWLDYQDPAADEIPF